MLSYIDGEIVFKMAVEDGVIGRGVVEVVDSQRKCQRLQQLVLDWSKGRVDCKVTEYFTLLKHNLTHYYIIARALTGWIICCKNVKSHFNKMIKQIRMSYHISFNQNSHQLIQMKTILAIFQEYLRKYPSPSQISSLPGLFKLNYVYSSPYTDSKITKEVYYPTSQLELKKTIQSNSKRIVYNEKGRIEESDSFDSILIKDKHEKVLQDDVFGKASHNKDYSRWVYVAEIKQEPVKSYFNEGKGKQVYQSDLGETFDDVKEVGLFVWDKREKKSWRVEIDKQLIPACPSFANQEATEILFHAYQKQHFGHGIIHCFNRPVSIYRGTLSLVPKQVSKAGEEEKKKVDQKPELKLQAKISRIITDSFETNIFPVLSPCLNYMVYLSGTGATHTYYLDLVIMKKKENDWVETHRIPQRFVGYYNTLKNYIIQEGGRSYAISQTLERSCHQIYKVDLETGELFNLTESFPNFDFCIQDVETQGLITGTVTSTNFNSFFYSNGKDIQLIEPPSAEKYFQKDYNTPIHAVYVEANEQDIHQKFRDRAKKRPLLVMPHGGPHGSFVQALTGMRYVLLKLGYGLLMPNFSGSAGYGKKHIEAALKEVGQKDSKEIIELLDIVLADNPNIDKTKVHVQGGSYGGYMSAILGSRYPQYFKSAIILNGVLNLIANLWFTDIPEWNTVQALSHNSLANLTEEDYRSMWRQSPASSPMKIPTLQFLGAKDRRVPYRQGLYFDAITKAAGTPITTYVYENSNHSLADSVETSLDVAIKSIFFLEGEKLQEKKE